jgi:hypothetical protein
MNKQAFAKPRRVWINAPSTHNPWHDRHGMRGIAFDALDQREGWVTFYFVEGKAISMPIDSLYLSDGWPE